MPARAREGNNDDQTCAGDILHPRIQAIVSSGPVTAVVKNTTESMGIDYDVELFVGSLSLRIEHQSGSVFVSTLEAGHIVRAQAVSYCELTTLVLHPLLRSHTPEFLLRENAKQPATCWQLSQQSPMLAADTD